MLTIKCICANIAKHKIAKYGGYYGKDEYACKSSYGYGNGFKGNLWIKKFAVYNWWASWA